MKKWISDYILGLVVLSLALATLVYSVTLEKSWITVFFARPEVYMVLVLSVLALLALLLVVRAWRRRKTEDGQERAALVWTPVPIVTVAVLFIYLLVLGKLGFLLDSVWMLWALTFLYSISGIEEDRAWCEKKTVVREAVKAGLFSVASSLMVYLVFTKILSVRLPVFTLF